MKIHTLILSASLGLAVFGSAQAATLTTSYASNNARRGVMFDISTVNPITIDSFDVNLLSGVSSMPMFVYYKTGTYVGFGGDSAAWTLLGSETVTSAGSNLPTPLAIGGLSLAAGTLTGLFITTDGSVNGSLLYYDGSTPVGNSDLTLSFGYGTAVPFDGSVFADRTWSGTIHYTVDSVPEPGQWAMMVVTGLGIAGYATRRIRTKA